MRIVAAVLAMAVSTIAQDTPPVGKDPAIALNNEAVAVHAKGRYKQAIVLLRRAIELRRREGVPVDSAFEANLVNALIGIAGRSISESRFRDATQHLDEALALNPKSGVVQAHYGILFYRQNQFETARSFLEEALTHDSGSALAHEYLGFVNYQVEFLQRALDSWSRAVNLDKSRKESLAPFMEKARRELAIEARMRTEFSSHFVCKYSDEHRRSTANEILDWLEDAYHVSGVLFHHYPRGRLSVILYGDRDFDRATRAHRWVGALFDGKIRIPIRNFDREKKGIRETIRHEYTHFIIRQLTRHCPAWLHEGLAQRAEGKTGGSVGRLLSREKKAGAIMELSSLKETFARMRNPARARLSYAVALSFTDYLVERFEISDIERLLRGIQKPGGLEKAFRKVFRLPLQEVEKAWLKTL